MRKEIRISGFGGQGVALAGNILGQALALHEGLEAVMTQSYGPEARGGASSSNIVFADRDIAYPIVQEPDILMALSQEAYDLYRPSAKPDAIVIIDEGLVKPASDDKPFKVPATKIAEELGRRIVANMVVLGFFTSVTGVIERDAVEKSIATSVRPKTVELNLKAFARGFDYASETGQTQ